jgi:hypothetical protein
MITATIRNEHGSAMRSLFIVGMVILQFATCSQYDAYREYVASNERANTTEPQNYKPEILALMRTYLNDPTQVRDAFISEPVIKSVEGADRYIVCMRYNAKKSDGKYAGNKDVIVTFRDGRLNRLIDTRDPREVRQTREQCKDIPLKPFVELQQLTR